jgi:hypothetical protein
MRQLQLRAQELGNHNLCGLCVLWPRAGKTMTDAGERNEPVIDTHFGKASSKPGGLSVWHVVSFPIR